MKKILINLLTVLSVGSLYGENIILTDEELQAVQSIQDLGTATDKLVKYRNIQSEQITNNKSSIDWLIKEFKLLKNENTELKRRVKKSNDDYTQLKKLVSNNSESIGTTNINMEKMRELIEDLMEKEEQIIKASKSSLKVAPLKIDFTENKNTSSLHSLWFETVDKSQIKDIEVNSNMAIVRYEPHTKSNEVKKLQRGDQIQVYSQMSKYGWYKTSDGYYVRGFLFKDKR